MNWKKFKTKYPEIAKKYEKRKGKVKDSDWVFYTSGTIRILKSV